MVSLTFAWNCLDIKLIIFLTKQESIGQSAIGHCMCLIMEENKWYVLYVHTYFTYVTYIELCERFPSTAMNSGLIVLQDIRSGRIRKTCMIFKQMSVDKNLSHNTTRLKNEQAFRIHFMSACGQNSVVKNIQCKRGNEAVA